MTAPSFETLISHIKQHKIIWIGGIIFLLLVLGIILLTKPKTQSNNPESALTPQLQNEEIDSKLSQNQSPPDSQRIIYYAKNFITAESSPPKIEIYSANTEGKAIKKRATINEHVKQIYPISNEEYLFIGDLGFLERGENIYKYNAVTDTKTALIHASDEFQIESYILLPDNQTLILWEESIGTTNTGFSQISSINLDSPQNKIVLHRQAMSDQIKYPVFYSDVTKKIYLDSYSAFKKGKNRGMFSLTLKGQLESLPGLSVNQYSSQPILSNNGKVLAYTSFNPGAKVIIPAPNLPNELLRVQIRNPNQIKLYDLTTNTSSLLLENLKGSIFNNLVFSADDSSIIYKQLTIENPQNTIPKNYNIINIKAKVKKEYLANPNGKVITDFPDNTSLIGMTTLLFDSLSSSLSQYSQVFDSLYIYDPANRIYSKILSDEPLQILAILNL